MAVRRSRMSGDFKLRRLLRNIHKNVDNELKPAMQKAADRVLQTMKDLVPKDTGDAAAALTAFVSSSGLNAEVGLRGKLNNQRYFYLRFIEYGTKGYSGKLHHRADSSAVSGTHTTNRDRSKLSGKNRLGRRDTKNKSDGATFFGKYPDIPARPAHPWLRPAMQVNREFVLAEIEAAITRTLRKASLGVGNG
ncbi:HK97-gp10 family putative phage morphogenesis protein [Pseudomonas tussilaginis]|uniref:HK97-gp10 family putative phage morphogenesis protein n=1 Tax=Pseudomonas putida TaxID=303 RepID=UPI002363B93C|nr:HK97-gp10 family putative phage morphogenesis protein [Pseudomonas putida]MDD1977122.1 HK97 gp10 family phage protein [Pseudomonas putida]